MFIYLLYNQEELNMKKIYYFTTIAVMLMTGCISSAQEKDNEVDTYKLYTEYLKPLDNASLDKTLKVYFIKEIIDFKTTEHYINKHNAFYNNPTEKQDRALYYAIVMGDNIVLSAKSMLETYDKYNEQLFDFKSTVRYYKDGGRVPADFCDKLIKEVDAMIAMNALNRAYCANYDI